MASGIQPVIASVLTAAIGALLMGCSIEPARVTPSQAPPPTPAIIDVDLNDHMYLAAGTPAETSAAVTQATCLATRQ
jgi:hypothetical protein